MLLTELVETSAAVARAPGRRVKIAEIASLLRRVPPDEVAVAVAFLSGELRQRQIGVGYAALTSLLRDGRGGRLASGPRGPGPRGPGRRVPAGAVPGREVPGRESRAARSRAARSQALRGRPASQR